jgi:hypothetical protein
MMVGGTQMFCLDGSRGNTAKQRVTNNDDGNLFRYVKQANKNIMYAMINSSMKELKVDEELIARNQNPWWKGVINGIDIGVYCVTGCFAVAFILTEFVFGRKKKEGPEA